MTDWIRRDYGGVGLTQSPPGRYLDTLRERYLGRVILCIDVSGSMATLEQGRTRLAHAVAGARRFVADAVAHHYQVGLILWSHTVNASVGLSADASAVLAALDRACSSGGTDVTPALTLGIELLGPLTGDRVLAVFGDGDIGSPDPAIAKAREAAALGIRIIVRGLGENAAAQLNRIATEGEGAALVADAADIEGGIASMVSALGHRRDHA